MEFDTAVAELDLLVDTLERDGDERALMLLQLMDAVHRPALELIVAGRLGHPVAHAVLSMYDLAPVEEYLLVEEALDEIRPYIESHGGGLDLLDVEVDTGVVHVRMHGSCHGCAASAITLRRGVEEKLRERLDWFTEVVSHEPEEDPQAEAPENGIAGRLLQIEHFNANLKADVPESSSANGSGSDLPSSANGSGSELLQIEGLKRLENAPRPVFVEVGPLAGLPPGTAKAFDVDGRSILVINIGGEPYAFRNVSPTDGRSEIEGGKVTGSVIVDPWYNYAYDARSGKRVDGEPGEPPLSVVPIAVQDGMLKVAATIA